MGDIVVDISHVSKIYRLYNNPIERLKDALGFSKNKTFREYKALDDVSFQVEKGKTIGLIGTNGAGKSTLLKIITGVLTQTTGQLTVNGKIAALLELGAGFNMEYTGMENIYLNGSIMGYTKDEMELRVPTIIEFAGIGDFIEQPVKTYSSGMFARLAFAVAINVDPEILIVDEALSVGDIYFQAKCFQKMDEIKKRGTTILLVTHDMSSVIKYCDHVIVLNKGKLLKQGSAKEMVDIYKKLLVNQYKEDDDTVEQEDNNIAIDSTDLWKDRLKINESNMTYGNDKAEIIDFGIFDSGGNLNNMITKKDRFAVKIKVEFKKNVYNPIFALTIKDQKGTEITGTNTMFENCNIEEAHSGEIYEVIFEQEMQLQSGDYLLSFGCTGFENGEFTVHHRLYDIVNISVISEQDTVGYYDMNSEVHVRMLQ